MLEGLGVPDNTDTRLLPIVAPITPQFTSLAGGLNLLTQPATMPWLFGSLVMVGLLTFIRVRSRRRRTRSELNH